ncbi:MAG: RIP metalloprotease RseP [Ignavibacteria bacterium]|nr:RIP metalloprotease RseP [Ignavibacteria bacterium]
MEILKTIFYFLITIGGLVFIHELGHFVAAKFFNMRIERFSIGFPPRAFGRKIGDTDYCVSWIPIGGYVKISGMIDESFDTDHLQREPQPWEYRSKPIWQRLIVITAGVAMNVVLALAILWGIIYFQGKSVYPVTQIGSVASGSAAEKAGLIRDDKILSVNGKRVRTWDEIEATLYAESMSNGVSIEVERAGRVVTLFLSQAEFPNFAEQRFGIMPKGVLPRVGNVDEGKPAAQIGIQPGDIIQRVNGVDVDYYTLPATMSKFISTEVEVEWKRGEEILRARVRTTDEGRIGIVLDPMFTGEFEKRTYSLLGALVEGGKDLLGMTGLFLKNIYAIIVGTVSFSESIGGPVMIAQIATRSAEVGLTSFLTVIAMLSMSLAILNLLPFPGLDGGHAMFLMYEGIFRREIPNKIKLALQQAGFFLLLAFMAFVLYNDILRF